MYLETLAAIILLMMVFVASKDAGFSRIVPMMYTLAAYAVLKLLVVVIWLTYRVVLGSHLNLGPAPDWLPILAEVLIVLLAFAVGKRSIGFLKKRKGDALAE